LAAHTRSAEQIKVSPIKTRAAPEMIVRESESARDARNYVPQYLKPRAERRRFSSRSAFFSILSIPDSPGDSQNSHGWILREIQSKYKIQLSPRRVSRLPL